MFTEFQLQNFKPWKDTKKQRLAPLTVFFGSNSAGKSSLSQFLLLLKQTVDSPDRQRVLHMGDRNSVTDLGTSHDMIYGHDESRTLEFLLSWGLEKPLNIHDPVSDKNYQGNAIEFSSGINSHEGRLGVETMKYSLHKDDEQILSAAMTIDENRKKYRLVTENYQQVRNKGRGWPLPQPAKFYGFPDEAVAYYQNTGFLADLTLSLEQLFSRLYYVGPLRGYPERSYIWSGEQVEHVGWRGERAVEAILAARDRKISRGYKMAKQPFEKVVARWLKQMGLIHAFEVRQIGEYRKEYEVLIHTRSRSSQVNLTDVGFGISQVLPIIVQSFYAPKGSTIIFEQPEIHLHPRVQADLADLFIEGIHAREEGENRRNQFIVEIHSEHFLRRLQRRIAEESVTPEEVAIYFCELGNGGSSMMPLEVDAYGNISNWPEHFFGDETEDLVAMTQAAMRRRSGK
ncbi:AAA family ATPase [Thiolapillus sp.]|uniref:AAA family ATPase n=1 Tax=Thiolapillus sp. TaxID=2017437 RepID=UPI003AF64D63